MTLRYAVVTPVRDEAANLRRLADAMRAQLVLPETWLIVDNGSRDGTPEIAASLVAEHAWISRCSIPPASAMRRGGPIVRAFHAGLKVLGQLPDVVVKLDADVSFEPDYFARQLAAFEAHPRLGMSSGSAWELRDGAWQQLFGTRTSVWGAARAYRRACLEDVLPLEERMGWDGVDELKATLGGWETRTLLDLPFRHHRLEGERDGARTRAWAAQGQVAHFMGYRPSYLLARTAHRARREPAALAMLGGYAGAALRGEPRLADARVRAHLRRTQRLRELRRRAREARGGVAVS